MRDRPVLLILAIVIGTVLLLSEGWAATSYAQLPCHVWHLGYWTPTFSPTEELHLELAFKLRHSDGAGSFARCLASSGWRVRQFQGDIGTGYWAQKGTTTISNSDGHGYITKGYFFLW